MGTMNNAFALLAVSVILAGCVTAANFSPTTVPTAELNSALSKVRLGLRDPEAAQFRNVRTFQADTQAGGGYVICGLVNGRNAYGGYTGFKPFRASISPQGLLQGLYLQNEGEYGTMVATAAPCDG